MVPCLLSCLDGLKAASLCIQHLRPHLVNASIVWMNLLVTMRQTVAEIELESQSVLQNMQ